jgi:hypothetical protein
MRGLTSTEVLLIWERGLPQSPAGRAVTLLAAVCADETPQSLARWPIGRRDARLLELRDHTFGPRLSSLTKCPACGEEVQAEFDSGDIRAHDGETEGEGEINHGDIRARFRIPNSEDIEAASRAADLESARQELLARCIVEPRDAKGTAFPIVELPPEFVAAIGARIAAVDPQADVELAIACPDCGHSWTLSFDIAGFFWMELQSCARRLLREVHELATAYGWSEADILALTPARRAAYLELARG